MTLHFSTISTYSHLYKVNALSDSLLKIHLNVVLHVLIIDHVKTNKSIRTENISYYNIEKVNFGIGEKIIKKYLKEKDKLRWSLKPVFLKYLIENNIAEKIIYVDNDIAFFNDFEFLFDELNNYNILLTPHHYPRYTDKMQNMLEANFKVGLYNAGFVAVNKYALNALEWWANACLYRCEKNSWRGLFDDQKYLDLFPVIEHKTLILNHQGCNVAEWNREVCKRTKDKEGNVLINEKWSVIFIHFNKTTVQCFLNKKDELLKDYFYEYTTLLKKYNRNLNFNDKFTLTDIISAIKLKIWQFLNYLN